MLRRRAISPLGAIKRRPALLALELAAIALGFPAAATYLRHSIELSLVTMLIPVVAILALFAAKDREFSLRTELSRGIRRADFLSVLALYSCAAIALLVWMYIVSPENLLAMPSRHTPAWLVIPGSHRELVSLDAAPLLRATGRWRAATQTAPKA